MSTRTPAAQLAPVAEALLDAARERAAALEEAAATQVREREQAAQAEANAIIDQARRDGEAVAERAAARMLNEARRSARELALHAQRAAYDAVRSEVRTAVLRRRDTDPVRTLLATLTDRARVALGSDAVVQTLAGDRLGVVADAGDRHLELDLDDVVDQELERAGERVLGIWR